MLVSEPGILPVPFGEFVYRNKSDVFGDNLLNVLECPDRNCFQITEEFRLCTTCKPRYGVYCSGGSAHWKSMKECYASEGPPYTGETFGSKTCWTCKNTIGPMGFGKGYDPRQELG